MAYASVADIQARLAYWVITATSDPSDSEIAIWLIEGEAMLNGALQGVGLPAPYIDAQAVNILRPWVCDYAEGRTRMAHVAAAGDGSNQDGQNLLERFYQRLADIRDNPAAYGAMLAAGSAPAQVLQMRAYVTDNEDGRSIAAGDFRPEYTRREVF